ncbi:MAG: hypothetical protein ACLFPF_10680 [Halanaerobiales bacterium]
MTKGPEDLPQNELPEIKDKKPPFYKSEPENLEVKNDNLLNFLNQILDARQLNEARDKKDSFEIENKIKEMDCKWKKGVLLYISRRLLSNGDKLKLIKEHYVMKDKLERSRIEQFEDVIKKLNEEEATDLLTYLVKNGDFISLNKTGKISRVLKEE